MDGRTPPISAGERDQIIEIQRRVAGQDARGQHTESWTPHLSGVWARARPLRGRERFAAGAMQVPASIAFGMTWRPAHGITPAMAVLWNGVRYALVDEAINVDGGNHTLELLCERMAA